MTCLGSSCPLCARSNDPWAFLLFQCRHSITPWNQSWSSPARVRIGIGHFELLITTDQPFLRAVVSFPSKEAHAVSGQSLGTSRRRVTLFNRGCSQTFMDGCTHSFITDVSRHVCESVRTGL